MAPQVLQKTDAALRPAADTKLKVFISYARQDGADFARELLGGLKLAGFAPKLDIHDIAKGEDWEVRLGGLIEEADTVVFIVTPASIKSARCDWEIKRTLALSKRLLPVIWIDVPEAEVPAELKKRNYTFFSRGRSFTEALAELVDALRVDLGWVRQHSRLGEMATTWEHAGQRDELLLRGPLLVEAQDWLKQQDPGKGQDVTAAQKRFIEASAEAAVRTLQEATDRARREGAQRRTFRLLSAAVIGALLLAGAGGYMAVNRQIQEQSQRDDEAYSQAARANDPAAFRSYLVNFPSGQHVGEAKRQITALDTKRNDDAYARALSRNDPQALHAYLEQFPEGRHRAAALAAIEQLAMQRDDAAYARAAQRNDAAAYHGYLEQFAKGRHREKALAELERLAQKQDDDAYARASAANEISPLQIYLQQFPHSHHRAAAQARIAELDEKTAADIDHAAWSRAQALKSIDGYADYLKAYPSGRHTADAQKASDQLLRIAKRWSELKEANSAPALRLLLDEATGTPYEGLIAGRVAEVQRAEGADWRRAEEAPSRKLYQPFLKAWPEGDHATDAKQRLTTIDQAERAWRGVAGARDLKQLEQFIGTYGYLDEPFVASALADIIVEKKRLSAPLPQGYTVLTADDIKKLMSLKTIKFLDTGNTLTFDSSGKPSDKLKIRWPYFQPVTKEKYAAEGTFVAGAVLNGQKLQVTGIGGIQESKVDKTGSLFLLQTLGEDRTEQDLGTKDRLYTAFQIYKEPRGYFCVGTQWAFALDKTPATTAERCTIDVTP